MTSLARFAIQNDSKLGAPGDEYNKSPWREKSPRLLRDTGDKNFFTCLKIGQTTFCKLN